METIEVRLCVECVRVGLTPPGEVEGVCLDCDTELCGPHLVQHHYLTGHGVALLGVGGVGRREHATPERREVQQSAGCPHEGKGMGGMGGMRVVGGDAEKPAVQPAAKLTAYPRCVARCAM